MERDKQKYKKLLQELLVQGLIKMIEPRLILKCRKSDEKMLREVIEPAIKIYKKEMMGHVKALSNLKDIPCKVDVDTKNYLPEWN